jgi:hypothetical protein
MYEGEETVMNIPSFDMLWISFRGDPEGTFSLIVPCCEVINGVIIGITQTDIIVSHKKENIELSHGEFKEAIEYELNDALEHQGFKKKKITQLSVQPAKTNDVIQILITQ